MMGVGTALETGAAPATGAALGRAAPATGAALGRGRAALDEGAALALGAVVSIGAGTLGGGRRDEGRRRRRGLADPAIGLGRGRDGEHVRGRVVLPGDELVGLVDRRVAAIEGRHVLGRGA